MTENHDRQSMERLRERLARADSELEAAQHFLPPLRRGVRDGHCAGRRQC